MPGMFDDIPLASGSESASAAAAAPPMPGGATAPSPSGRVGMFDDIPMASATTAPTGGKGKLVLSPLPGEAQGGTAPVDASPKSSGPPKPADESVPTVAADVAQSAGAGLIRGAAGMVDLPQTAFGLINMGTEAAAQVVSKAVRARHQITPPSRRF